MPDELIVDSFAGGGGASTGIELATGRPVDIAINHDPDAILMHKTNHPHTEHIQASVWDVDPEEACAGRPVGLLWASPDCKHFSKAKGGKPVDKHIRGLAWIVLRWAGTVRPRVIILENVEEFQTWGPVRRGRPVKSKAGQTFTKWLEQLRDLGYDVEWCELVAADYGAPTTRKRFFLIARCDGRPIAWPEPTHAPADSAEVKAGLRKPWRSAAEIIDWSLPCPSIFDTRDEVREKYGLTAQRPLSPNTMRRVIRGVDKFVIRSSAPYVVHAAERPGERGACRPYIIQYHTERHEHVRGQNVTEPLMTIDAANRYGLAAASEPVQTITAGGGHHGVVTTEARKAEPGAELHNWPKIRGLLNIYCGYALADDEVLLLELGGAWYFIADIGLRMLIPRELYCANGFPDDYIIDRDYTGREYPKSKQIARCGNAVPPPFAEALVRANLPEWCES